jgi:uncharacterized membrane protein YkoI
MKKQLIIVGLMLVTLTACGTQGNGGRVISQDTRTNTAPSASAATLVQGGSIAQSGTPSGGANTVTYITEEQAKEIAFNHASVTKDNVSLLRVQFDFDDWRAVYEVDFYSDYNEYDYDIDATTGEILGYDVDMEHNAGAIPQTGTTSAANQSQTTSAADQNTQPDASASQVAQADASAANNTQPDASTSQVAQAAAPAAQNTQAAAPSPAPSNNTSNDSWISSTDAENAALSHAGVTGSDVIHLRSHLDRDDGRTMYEVSFYYNYMEYEYDIDALTGNILSFDQDYD